MVTMHLKKTHSGLKNGLKMSKKQCNRTAKSDHFVQTAIGALIRRFNFQNRCFFFRERALTTPACNNTRHARCWEGKTRKKREIISPLHSSLSSVCFKRALEKDQRVSCAQIYRLRRFKRKQIFATIFALCY